MFIKVGNLRKYERQLQDSFRPCVDAAKSILIKLLYALLIFISAMLVIHIICWILWRCLHVRYQSVVRRVYARPTVPVDSSVQTFIHRVDGGDSEYDSEEDDTDYRRHIASLRVPPSIAAPSSLYSGSLRSVTTQQPEVKYSETNV